MKKENWLGHILPNHCGIVPRQLDRCVQLQPKPHRSKGMSARDQSLLGVLLGHIRSTLTRGRRCSIVVPSARLRKTKSAIQLHIQCLIVLSVHQMITCRSIHSMVGAFFKGIRQCCEHYKVSLIGGDSNAKLHHQKIGQSDQQECYLRSLQSFPSSFRQSNYLHR